VLGPVPGFIGLLQAMETLKVVTGIGKTMHSRLLMYDALECSFLTVKKPSKRPDCPVCGTQPSIRSMQQSRENLVAARGPTTSATQVCNSPLPEDCNVSCKDYHQLREQGFPHVLVDVRVKQQFEMCHLDGAINIPLANLPDELDRIQALSNNGKPIYCICRRGVASTQAAQILLEARASHAHIHSVRNITGGLTAWHDQVDGSFPKY
jgi:rhodanese-related sulfurtransferase